MKFSFLLISCLCAIVPLFAQNENLEQLSFQELDSLYTLASTTDLQLALDYAEAAQNKAAKLHGKKDTLYADYSINVGLQYAYTSNYEKALDVWEKAGVIYLNTFGNEHKSYVDVMSNIALLHFYLGNYKESEKMNLQANELKRKVYGETSSHYCSSICNLGLLYWKIGRWEEAEPLFLQSKAILEEHDMKEEGVYASTIGNLASLYFEMGRLDEVEPLYIKTRELMKKFYGESHPDYAYSLVNLAALYFELGDYYKAEQIYVQHIALTEKYLGRNTPNYAYGLTNLSSCYAQAGRLDEAIKLVEKSSQMMLDIYGNHHLDYLEDYTKLARQYFKRGWYEKSIQKAEDCAQIVAKNIGKRHLLYLETLLNLIKSNAALKDYEKTRAYINESILVNTGLEKLPAEIGADWKESIEQASCISQEYLSTTLEFLYEVVEAENPTNKNDIQYWIAALDIERLQQHRNEYISEKDKLRALKTSAFWTNRIIHNLVQKGNPSDLERAFQFAELNKSVLLGNAIQTERAYSFGALPDSLVQREKDLEGERSELTAALLEITDEEEVQELQEALSEVNLAIDQFKALISKEYPKYNQLKYAQQEIDVQALQQLLDEKTAILEYVVGDSFLYVFYIDQKKLEFYPIAIHKEELTRQVKKLHDGLSDYVTIMDAPNKAYFRYTESAHWFYQQLIAPVLTGKEGIKDLVVVTDGELGHLPFETFLVEDAPQRINYKKLHYLINDYTISYDYAAALWKENLQTEEHHGAHQMLALAADYSPKKEGALKHLLPTYQSLRKTLQPLPDAQKEIDNLSSLLEGNFLSGAAVNEAFFKEKAKEYSIIHLAMHGILNHDSPILSALAFSENGDTVENNFLQAYEISKLELNASLVVLSACETGYGEFEEGNGIASLARSFMYAGVPSLVVSLWQVNDQCTGHIMEMFYTNLKEGMNKAEALRQAKLTYLKRAERIAAHPAFWSPFIQLGARTPVQLSTPINLWLYGGVLIGLVVLAIGIVRLKSKKEMA